MTHLRRFRVYRFAMNIARAAAPILIVGLLLSGCAQQTPAPTAEPSSPPTETVPSPAPTQPALDELVLTPDGLGSIVIGEAPVAADPALDILIFDPDYCQSYVDSGAIADAGKWIPNYEPALSEESSEPFSVYLENDVVQQLAVDSAEIVTAEGVGLGSSRADVVAAYPDASVIQRFNTSLYVVEGERGRLVIEIGEPGQGEYAVDEVVFLRATSLDDEVSGWANTDAGFAFCTSA